jgi:tetratricopeptide (TPR) repeat protein
MIQAQIVTPPSPTPSPPPRHQAPWICLFLAVITLAAYWPVTGYEFVSYDDSDFITANPIVQAGLTAQGLHYIWRAEVARNWHPLTLLSHMLDCQLFGLNAGWHHLTSLLLHVANTLLLFCVLRRMTASTWRSALVAALFALHPLHVESVAWIAERKDVLSTLFWWLTLWAWLCYAGARKVSGPKSKLFYLLSLFLFVLALMSKPMVVTLPCVLLLLDVWPLARLNLRKQPNPAIKKTGAKSKPQKTAPVTTPRFWQVGRALRARRAGQPGNLPPLTIPNRPDRSATFTLLAKQETPLRLILEKIPFFALSAILCAITFAVQKHGGAMLDMGNLPLHSRLGNALVSYVRYAADMFWPSNLAALYLRTTDWAPWQVGGAAILLVAVTGWVVLSLRTRPWLAFGWFWYLGTLVPVIGLVQVGMQTMADRYTYIPLVGLFIMLVWGAAEFSVKFRLPQPVPAVIASLALGACFLLTARQIQWWKNSETLYKRMIDVTENNYMAHYNLGNLYNHRQKFNLAIAQYQEAIAEQPIYADAHNNLAGLFLDQKRYDDAIAHYLDAARIQPGYFSSFNLANAYADAASARHDTNLFAQAVAAFQQALQLNPRSSDAHNNFGMTWQAENRDQEAIAEFQAAVRVNPDFELAHFNLANALSRAGNLDEAILHYQTAERLNPARVESCNGAGVALAMRGKMEEAAREFSRVIQLSPRDSGAYGNLANALSAQKKYEQAVPCYLKALQINPRDYKTEFNLGVSLLYQNRRDDARTHFQAALRLHPDYPEARQALAELDAPAK